MERLLIRVTSLVAFAIVLATDILYVGLIGSQGQDFQPYVPRFVASARRPSAGCAGTSP